jgi:uncharacterized protein YbgA (DUF1722 family)/uncharacterized protein YbbK (DUF523 family)
MEKIRVGISSCLLGHKVRYDGGHRLEPFIAGTLGKFVELVPVCPEVECGLSVPREAMRLLGEVDAPRLITIRTQIDYTDRMLTWARRRVSELEDEKLCGFIFKSKSPSSGMERVKVYNPSGPGLPRLKGVGLFARVFMEHFPLLPVEDEGRLHDPALRENFIERIFIFRRWRDLLATPSRPGNLVAFHTRHKLQILAHSPGHYRLLGKLVARAKELPFPEVLDQYQTLLLESLRLLATRSKNTNVLQHTMGYFKKELSPAEKRELLEVITSYQRGYVPLIVPITLINHYVRKYRQPYLEQQFYLAPHPLELQLRNHV